MKAIMVMFDSLNRHMLPPYGCDWTHAPNFARLARRSLTFERAYVGSMPCMPARRELHTARPNFLHRSWGPIEPFDDSMPEILKNNGVHTHLCSDHYHYWEDGGATYHGRYSTWEFFRGQEGDPWIGQISEPEVPETLNATGPRLHQDWANRHAMRREGMHSQERTIAAGLQFIERNKNDDNWFLQIECFDPHEPFFNRRLYRDLYPDNYDGPLYDWPRYGSADYLPELAEHVRHNYAASLSMCDAHLGDVLDAMDAHHLWDDTMLIVWTDHGFLLGEHNCWAKGAPPLYEEISHTPFFMWDPRSRHAGERRQTLVQPALDLAPTLLEYFGQEPTPDMLGKSLTATCKNDTPVREAALFGYHGRSINVTVGRYVYLRAPVQGGEKVLFNYTLTPTKMRGYLDIDNFKNITVAEPFSFTKGCQTLKLPVPQATPQNPQHLLFDLQNDPAQEHPLNNEKVEAQMIEQMKRLMQECDAPAEQFARVGLA